MGGCGYNSQQGQGGQGWGQAADHAGRCWLLAGGRAGGWGMVSRRGKVAGGVAAEGGAVLGCWLYTLVMFDCCQASWALVTI